MSYYTIFEQVEATLTASTTAAALAAADVMIVHNQASGKKFQVPVGALGAGISPVTFFTTLAFYSGSTATSLGAYSTSASTAFAPSYGVSCFRSTTGTSCIWMLNDPPVVGQTKTLVWDTTTTCTGFFIQPVSATITSTGSPTSVFVNFANATISPAGSIVQLIALTTARWTVGAHSTGVLFS